MTRAIALVFLSGLLLAGCGDDNNSQPTPSAPSPAPAPAPAANPARLDLSASPTQLLASGGTTTITGRLTDTAGAPLANRTVQFAASTGSLSNTLPTTNASGEATATLTANGPVTILASAAGLNASLTVPGVAPFTVTVEPKYSVIGPNEDDDIFITITQAPGFPNAPTPATVVLSCGNGDTKNLGSARTSSCRYKERGNWEVAVTASAGGYSTTGTTRITTEGRPISLTLSVRQVAKSGLEIEIEFIVVGAPSTSVCTWDLGVTHRTGACNQNYVYESGEEDDDGNIKVSVSVDTKQGHDITLLEATVPLDF